MKHLVLATFLLVSLFRPEEAMARWDWLLYNTEDVRPVLTVGARAGIHMQYLSGKTLWSRQYDEGPVGGLFISVHQHMIGGRIEGNIRQTSYRNTRSNIEVNIINVDIPLLFEFRPVRFLKIHAGGQLTSFPFVEDAKHKDIKRYFKSVDCAVVFGVEGELPLNLIAGGRFTKGLLNINDTGLPGTWTTTGVQFYVGYHLPTD